MPWNTPARTDTFSNLQLETFHCSDTNVEIEVNVVLHNSNLSIQETEAGGMESLGQHWLYLKTCVNK